MSEIWDKLTDKRQLVLKEREGKETFWKINLSPLSLWACIVGLVVVIFFILLLLMAYTSILDILPKYRTKSEKLNEQLTEHIMRLDLMERNMEDILAYNEAVATIMGGSTPTLQSSPTPFATTSRASYLHAQTRCYAMPWRRPQVSTRYPTPSLCRRSRHALATLCVVASSVTSTPQSRATT